MREKAILKIYPKHTPLHIQAELNREIMNNFNQQRLTKARLEIKPRLGVSDLHCLDIHAVVVLIEYVRITDENMGLSLKVTFERMLH